MLTLDLKDKKILYELSINARLTYAELGKKVRLHKDTVAYRMKQLEEKGVISGYTMFFHFGRLGFRVYKLYVKFRGASSEKIQHIAHTLKEREEVGWVVFCQGNWDMIIGVMTSSVRAFTQLKQWFEREEHDFIYELKATTHVEAYFYSRDYFLQKHEPVEVTIFKEEKRNVDLDKKDWTILEMLVRNSRMAVVEIAQKTGLTARTVAYRIKRLEKEKVILQYRASLNLEQIGYIFVKAFIRLQNISEQERKKIIDYCKFNPHIIHNVECLGDWDIEPEFEVHSIEDFYTIIQEMRQKFAQQIMTVESVIINRELKYGYVPRLT